MFCALHSNIILVHKYLETCVTQISIMPMQQLNSGPSPPVLAKRSLVAQMCEEQQGYIIIWNMFELS